MVSSVCLPASSYTLKKVESYVDWDNRFALFTALAYRAPLLLEGPKGTGKTLAFQAWSHRQGVPIVTFDCSEDIRRPQLVGMHVPREDGSAPFVLGALTTAIQVANEAGQAILCLEEISALAPQSQKILNPLTDFRRRIAVPEAETIFEVKNGAKLWVVGTYNDVNHGGVYDLNQDLRSRFRIHECSYPGPKEEGAILSSRFPKNHHIKPLLTLAKETRARAGYALSTRDLMQVLEDAEHLPINQALELAIGKCAASERAEWRKRIQSIR